MRSRLVRIYKRVKKLAARKLTSAQNIFYRPHPHPIFIVGNEKSGTTIIAASLAKATQQTVTLDIEGLWDPVQTKLFRGEIALSKVIARNAKAFSRQIIKEPVLTFEIEQLKHLYPNAKYVLIVRDPRDNIRSILNRLDLPGNLAQLSPHHIRQLGELWVTWNTVLDNSWLGLKTESYIASMASRWSYIMNLYLHQPEKVAVVKYEDFLADKIGTIHELATQLDLAVKEDISTFVHRQFQPKGNREIGREEFFGKDNLAIINESCSKEMTMLGYKVNQ